MWKNIWQVRTKMNCLLHLTTAGSECVTGVRGGVAVHTEFDLELGEVLRISPRRPGGPCFSGGYQETLVKVKDFRGWKEGHSEYNNIIN